ncbi:MAG: hypothetical protein QOG10_891, partial [Kribbellaceae bacterium]|nr:hypothetical protein [Kribbellaceae bacterium]
MNEYDPTNPHETLAQPASSPASSASATTAKQARRPNLRRKLSTRKSAGIAATALTCTVIGLSAGYAASASAAATSPSAAAASPSLPAAGGGGSNARSGPAAGGATGTVDSVSTSSFTMSTAGSQKVTVKETSATKYRKGTTSTSASAVTTGERILVLGTTTVLGTTSGSTIAATQVIVESSRVGHIPANYV